MIRFLEELVFLLAFPFVTTEPQSRLTPEEMAGFDMRGVGG
jgi:hypothetical protein